MKINETPIRTSRNFKINNINIEDVDFLEDVKNFQNVDIDYEDSSIKLSYSNDKILLEYGLGDFLQNELNEKSNVDLNIEVLNKEDKENKILFNFDENNLKLVSKINIVANKDTDSSFIIMLKSKESVKAYSNILVNIEAKENSKVSVIVLNLLNNFSSNFLSINNTLYENSKIDYKIIDFGGKYSITNYYSNLIGNDAFNDINTIYIGGRGQTFDLNYITHLRGEKTSVNIDVQGALSEDAKKNFKGTIDFKKGCKKAVGNEEENCILLSNEAKGIALPMLLCSEEDVEGNHSTSAGKINEKEMFYIMSRGFSKKEAEKLMVRARFNKVIETIKDENLKEVILYEIDKRLD